MRSREHVLAELRETFGRECLPLNLPAEGGQAVVDCFFQPGERAAGLLVGRGRAHRNHRPGRRGRRGADGAVPRAGRGADAGATARSVRAGAARRPPDAGVFRLRRNRRRHAGAAGYPRAADAESARGQSAALPERRRREAERVEVVPDPDAARGRARVQGQHRSVRRPPGHVPRASRHGAAGLAAVRRRCAQAVQGRASVPAARQGARGGPARDSRRHLRRLESRRAALRCGAARLARRRSLSPEVDRVPAGDGGRRDRAGAARRGTEALRRACTSSSPKIRACASSITRA